MCSRPGRNCAASAASTRFTTTTASRAGWCAAMVRSRMSSSARRIAALVALGVLVAVAANAAEKPSNMGVGRPALPEEIAAWDTDVQADGKGAPSGRGTVKQGEEIYLARCASCHGEFGQGAGRWPALAG